MGGVGFMRGSTVIIIHADSTVEPPNRGPGAQKMYWEVI